MTFRLAIAGVFFASALFAAQPNAGHKLFTDKTAMRSQKQ
jgi:hypothetical protein